MPHPMMEMLTSVLAPIAEHVKPDQIKELLAMAEEELNQRPLIHMAWKEARYRGPEKQADGSMAHVDRTYTQTYEIGQKNPSDEDATVFAIFPHETGGGIVVYSCKDVEIDGANSVQYWSDFIYRPDGWRGQMSAQAVANYTEYLLSDGDDDGGDEPDPAPAQGARANGHA